MRVDKYLKVSRLIKRRTVASEACSSSRVTINGKVAKPSSEVKAGDILEITLGGKPLRVEVLAVSEHVQKAAAETLYRVI